MFVFELGLNIDIKGVHKELLPAPLCEAHFGVSFPSLKKCSTFGIPFSYCLVKEKKNKL